MSNMLNFDCTNTVTVYEYDFEKKYTHVEGYLIDPRLSDWFNWLQDMAIKPANVYIYDALNYPKYAVKTDLYWEHYNIELWFSAGFIFLGIFLGFIWIFLGYSVIEIVRMFKEELVKEINWHWWLGTFGAILEIWGFFFLFLLFFFSMHLIYNYILLPITWDVLEINYNRYDRRVAYIFVIFWTFFWVPRFRRLYRNFNNNDLLIQIRNNRIQIKGFLVVAKIKSDSKQKEIYFWENWKYNDNLKNTDDDYRIWMIENGYSRFDPITYDPGNYITNLEFENDLSNYNLVDIEKYGYINYGEGFYISNHCYENFLTVFLTKFLHLDNNPRIWSWAFINQYHLNPILHCNTEFEEDIDEEDISLLDLLHQDTYKKLHALRSKPALQSNNKALCENYTTFLSVEEFYTWLTDIKNRDAAILIIAYWSVFNSLTLNNGILFKLKINIKYWIAVLKDRIKASFKEDPAHIHTGMWDF